MKKEKYKILISLMILSLVLLTSLVVNQKIYIIDEFVYSLIYHNGFITSVMKIITLFGEEKFLILFTICLLVIFNRKKDKAFIGINIFLISILNQTFKEIIKRPRPNVGMLIKVRGYSFPSGHAAVSLAFYGLLIFLIRTKLKNKKQKTLLTIFLSLLIVMIGVSRVYLGVHYASDVIGGFLFSSIYLAIVINAYNKF